jgi:hypothetical protein
MKNIDRNQYQFTRPPKALLRARLDNIAIVPASMLPLKKTVQELLSGLPPGAVFLCHSQENVRQRKLLERVGETFRQHGHAVVNLPRERLEESPPRS